MTSPLRLAIVADGDPASPSTNSGVSKGVMDALAERSDVEIHALIDSAPSRAGSILLTLLSWRPRLSEWRNLKRKGRLATKLRSAARDRAIAALAIPPDVILHVRNTYLPSALPYVVFVDGTASLSQRSWPDWRLPPGAFRRRVAQEKAFFSRALFIATAGEHAAREVVSFYGQDVARVGAIGGGTNLDVRDAVAHAYDRNTRADGAVRFLFVGKEFERKGGPELLAAFRTLREIDPKCELTIVGPERPRTAVPDGVEWRGYVGDRTELRRIYRNADVFCLLSRYEPYGLVIQEALANGLPCLVSNRGALPEIAGSAGLVVDIDSGPSILEGMRRLATDGELRDTLSRNASERLLDLSWDRVAARLMDGIARSLR